jgi:hypothetical protein
VGRLKLLRGLGEQEGAPVGVAAHDAALRQDDVACRFGDSRQCVSTSMVSMLTIGSSMAYSFTSERRPGRTCRALSAMEPRRTVSPDIPLLSFRTASCLAGVVSRGALRTVTLDALDAPAAKRFGFRARYATRPTYTDILALIISPESPPSAPHDCALRLPLRHYNHPQNGRSIFCCPRCAPIDTLCGEEARALCVPAMAAAGAKAAAILGICRVYVDRSCQQLLKITLAG